MPTYQNRRGKAFLFRVAKKRTGVSLYGWFKIELAKTFRNQDKNIRYNGFKYLRSNNIKSHPFEKDKGSRLNQTGHLH